MGTMACQITSLTIVYSTRLFGRTSKKTSKLRVTGLCAGNSPIIGEFPAQGPVTRKMFPFDDVIMMLRKYISDSPPRRAYRIKNVLSFSPHYLLEIWLFKEMVRGF